MCERTDRDKVDTLFGIVADGIEGNSPTRLRLETASNHVDGLLRIGHCEVVEHDAVNTSVVEHLLEFVERAHLDLDLQVKTFLFEILMATVDGIHDATREVDVVVFEQDHVEESDAVVTATANLHSLLLEHTHARGSLAGVEHTGVGTLQSLHILISHCSNTAHALHDVEHESLGLQQRAYTSADNHGDVTLLHTGAVLHEHLDLHLRVEATEHLLGNLHTSENTILLDEQMRLSHRILGDATEGGMVAVTDILGKRQINQSVDQFVYA